jgi:hypothetical protein
MRSGTGGDRIPAELSAGHSHACDLGGFGPLPSLAAWLAGATFWWLVAGGWLGSVIPFTLIVILPTNKKLLNPTLDTSSAETERLLIRWGGLHAVRSVLSALVLLFLYLLIFIKS